MKILITGSEGFIGRHLQGYLKYFNNDVVCVDRKLGKEVMDITGEDLQGIDIVIHLAGQTSVWNSNYMQIVKDNIEAFTHIFFLCKCLNVKFIYASSSCAYNPTTLYGISKTYDELLSTTYKYGVGLRLHNVYGYAARPDTLLGACLNNDEVTLWNNGLNTRHFTYVGDVCSAIVKAFDMWPGLYNVCNMEASTTLDFVREVQKFKPISVKLSPEKRQYDKEDQDIDCLLPNIDINYVDIAEGIKSIFSIANP